MTIFFEVVDGSRLMRRVWSLERSRPGSRVPPGIDSTEAGFSPSIRPRCRTGPIQIVHLDGLNLSRAWCMRMIAGALPESDPVRPILLESAARHAQATLPHIASGNYEGEHWLATFAVFMMTERSETLAAGS